jgi:ankyrin repeat protein
MKIKHCFIVVVFSLFAVNCLQGQFHVVGASLLHPIRWYAAAASNFANNYFSEEPVLIALTREGKDLDAIRYYATLDPNVKDRDGWTALHIAVSQNDIPVIKTLLSVSGINPNGLISSANLTALHIAAAGGFIESMNLLINSGADVDQCLHSDAGSPLFYAVSHGAKISTIAYLVFKGANPRYIDKRGNNLLHHAFLGDLDLINYLLTLGVDINHPNHEGMTPLLAYAQRLGSTSGDRELRDAELHGQMAYFVSVLGVDIHHTSVSGWNLLNIAASHGWKNTVAYCVRSGVNSNTFITVEGKKIPPLFWAVCKYGDYDMVRILVEEGNADVNAYSAFDGSNLLHCNPSAVIYDFLVAHEANTSVVNNGGCSPEDLRLRRKRVSYTHEGSVCESALE